MSDQPEEQGFHFILAVDTVGWTDHDVDERELLVRKLHEITFAALRDAGLDIDPRERLDRGDGFAIIFPAGFDRYVNLIHPFLANVEGGLDEYNRQQAARRMWLRLRVAMNYGKVVSFEDTHVGAVDELFRLLDCPPLRRTLERAPDAHLAVLVSGFVYNNAVRPRSRRIDPAEFHRVELNVKGEGIAPVTAWLHLPGIPDPGLEFWQSVIPEPTQGPTHRYRRFGDAVLSALGTAATAVWAGLRWGIGVLLGRWPPPRWVLIGGGAVLVAAALVVGYLVVVAPTVGACPVPTALNVLTSTSSERPVRDAAVAYQRTQRSHGCVRVDMTVYAVPDGEARQALNDGWRNSNGLPLGPPPNIWMPDTTADRGLLDASLIATSGLSLTPIGTTRTSPYVVGVPTADAQRLGTEQLRVGWPSFYKTLLQAKLKLARPSTATSTTALAQTDGIWTDIRKMPDAPKLGELEHQLNDPDLSGTDEADLMCKLRNYPAPHTAVLVTERALAAYNTGAALNDHCPATDPLGDNERLIPYVPTTRRVADYPMYEVTYHGPDRTEHSEIEAFYQWLAGGSSPMAAAGYRGPDRVARGMLTGSDAGRIMTSLGQMNPVTGLAKFSTELTDQRGDVRLLVALDVSGSLNDRATTEGTPYDLSLNAVRTAKGAIMSHDRIALWRFPGRSDSGHEELAGFGSTHEPNAGVRKVSDVLSDPPSPTARKTPLYRTIIDGVNELAREAGPHTRLGLLVISDGKDEPSRQDKVSAADVRRVLHDAGRDVHIAVVDPVRGGCAGSSVAAIGVTCMPLVDGDAVSTFLAGLWGG